MYIEPNTTIMLLQGCPLEPSHENTLYFESLAEQETYFHAILYNRAFTRQSYQRVNKNTIRLAANAESLYDYTYMTFRNVNFGNKWFYAFVDKIEYINNATCEITYTIDVIQTWMFDYVLMPCFVEREHSITDEIGDNIVEEGLGTGDYVSDDLQYTDPEYYEGYSIYVWATFDRNYNDSGGQIIDSGGQPYFSGLTYTEFPLTDTGIAAAKVWLAGIPSEKLDGVVSINVAPKLSIVGNKNIYFSRQTIGLRRTDGTAPKNNKLYTFPYCGMYVTNNLGETAVYRYEFFEDSVQYPGYCGFSFFTDLSPNPSTILTPLGYKGVNENYDESITISQYPQVGYNVDSFKAWVAQSSSNIITTGLSSVGGIVAGGVAAAAGVATGGIVLAGAIIGAIGLALKATIADMKPPQATGRQDNMTLLALNKLKFGFMHKHITREYVTMIDDYFSMFGYATKKLKRPNIMARPEWSYVKTIGCEIEGTVPTDDAIQIQNIFDKGIRFWRWPEHYLHYEYDNSPVVQQGEGNGGGNG